MRLSALILVASIPLHATVIGVSKPAESITQARIDTLPAAERAAWSAYLERSNEQQQRDRAALAAERAHLATIPPLPKESSSARSIPRDRDAAFYRSPEARHIADTILSFQLPNGGWSKNLDMSGPARLRGQSYMADNLSKHLSPDDFDAPRDPLWNYAGTLDNDATNTELHFLALVAKALPGDQAEPYEGSFVRGVEYLLHAQFPNGGWPQVWPLEGGYHDAITFNDNAVTESASLLTGVAEGQHPFVPAPLRTQAGRAAEHAVECILKTQIVLDGKRTIWAQQHDALTLKPVSGRNFEPAALSTGESSDALIYLMELPHPNPEVQAAIRAGVLWLKQHEIHDRKWSGGRDTPGGRQLTASPGAAAIWARYYSLETQRPVFGDRDKTIHDNVNELTLERRNGYAWYSAGPQEAIDRFDAWARSQPGSK